MTTLELEVDAAEGWLDCWLVCDDAKLELRDEAEDKIEVLVKVKLPDNKLLLVIEEDAEVLKV